jgi:hypothetical protein
MCSNSIANLCIVVHLCIFSKLHGIGKVQSMTHSNFDPKGQATGV